MYVWVTQCLLVYKIGLVTWFQILAEAIVCFWKGMNPSPLLQQQGRLGSLSVVGNQSKISTKLKTGCIGVATSNCKNLLAT